MTYGEALRAVAWLNDRIKAHGFQEEFPETVLPRTGLVCYEDGILRAVVFIYFEKTSSIAVCGWCIANPKNKPRSSYNAVKALFDAVPEFAKENGATMLLSTFGNRGINKIAKEAGFIVGEKAVNMFKAI